MTVSRDRGYVYFECDANGGRCPEVCETHVTDFSTALEIVREAGWSIINEGTRHNPSWRHYCPDEEMDSFE